MIHRFSKMSREEKIQWLSQLTGSLSLTRDLDQYRLEDERLQSLIDSISENSISNFHLPYSISPNFLINEKVYAVPTVIEESSVVAALSNSAKIWHSLGGFHSKVLNKIKTGQVHFLSYMSTQDLNTEFNANKSFFLKSVADIDRSMRARGGGVLDIYLKDYTDKLDRYFTLELEVNTCDAMGANYINTLLEKLRDIISQKLNIDVIMCILSNRSEQCLVEVQARANVHELGNKSRGGRNFASRFKTAVDMACVNFDRAVTHNKGILNGIDALAMATGNDFRAIEAAAHSFAIKDSEYKSLSSVDIFEDEFEFSMTIPLSIGTVGGLTKVHPLAKVSLDILGNPDSNELMCIMAAVGLAQNFAAVRTLVTEGIQAGHMKMHLNNITHMLNLSKEESQKVEEHFEDKNISVSAVREFVEKQCENIP